MVLHEYSIARESINLAQTITISFPTDKEALYVDYYVISSCIEKNNTFFLVYVYAELELDIFNGSLQTKKKKNISNFCHVREKEKR